MAAPQRSSAPTEPDPSILQHLRRGTDRSSNTGALRRGNQQPQIINIDSQGLANQHRQDASDEIELLSPIPERATNSDPAGLSAIDIEAAAGAECK
jgi:hypothetical protein